MVSNWTGQHWSKVPQRLAFELLSVFPPVWIKSSGVTYNVCDNKWTLCMTSEGQLNPQQGPGRSVSSRCSHCENVNTSKRQRLIMHCAVHKGCCWAFNDTVLVVSELTARL